jgi:hypothetical protein
MPARSGGELTAIAANIEFTLQHLRRLRRHRNFLASPLLRLPTELIIEIFEHATESNDDADDDSGSNDDDSSPASSESCSALLVLIAICSKLREIGLTTPRLWGTVDLAVPSLARLFLERCNNDPHLLKVCPSSGEGQSISSVGDPGRDVWLQLEGRAFNNLHTLFFKGEPSEFKDRIVPILQRPTNIEVLDLQNLALSGLELPWHPSAPIPRLSDLRLRGFSISWTSPLFRNLTRLTVDHGPAGPSSEPPSIEAFLTALARCPDLELLKLDTTGLDPLSGHRDDCDMVVQLRRLREITLQSNDASTIGCVLSYIRYPESTSVGVSASVGSEGDISRAVSQVFPRGNANTVTHIKKTTKSLVIDVEETTYTFSTEKSRISFKDWVLRRPQGLTHAGSKTMQVVGGVNITILSVSTEHATLTEGVWVAFLHGLPRLQLIKYQRYGEEEDRGVLDPFVLIFSIPFRGGPVCPRLIHLELPKGALTRDPSSTMLKRALTERKTCGRGLRFIGLSGDTKEQGDVAVLETFRDLVDLIQ